MVQPRVLSAAAEGAECSSCGGVDKGGEETVAKSRE